MNPPEGFRYRDDVLTSGEERAYTEQFAALEFKPFEFRGYLGKRRVVAFGWRYDYAGRVVRQSQPLPEFLLPLRERAADFAGVPVEHLQQALVTEYEPGAPIGWHRDKPEFGDVIAFSFLSPARLRLRRSRDTGWERWAIDVQPRSAYLLRGLVRHDWEHSIPPVEALRYSVTFRTLRDER
jgi:alkylated DNA repair dioxygenase AlkB